MEQKKFEDLEERFFDYACKIADIVSAIPDNRAGNYIADILMKASYSTAVNYSERQLAGSRNDFISAMSGILGSLKECRNVLQILRKKEMIKPVAKLEAAYSETEILIAIIGKSISTARKNKAKKAAELQN